MARFRRLVVVAAAGAVLATAAAGAQPPVAKPQPPPKPPVTATAPGGTPAPTTPAQAQPAKPVTEPGSQSPVAKPAAPGPAPAVQAAPQPAAAAARPAAASLVAEAPPPDGSLGVPVLPNAVFLGSYDAGGAGQRFYLYGTANRFADVVGYYRTVLRDRGELVFDVPATHTWEVGRFREDQVAFPPGVTVKDYTFAGSPGLANPKPGASPVAFPTVIQIVPPATAPLPRSR